MAAVTPVAGTDRVEYLGTKRVQLAQFTPNNGDTWTTYMRTIDSIDWAYLATPTAGTDMVSFTFTQGTATAAAIVNFVVAGTARLICVKVWGD
jgi:hypothetical protein